MSETDNSQFSRSGIPFNDEDRIPWLEAIAQPIDRWRAEGLHGAIACSALKCRCRDIIIIGVGRMSVSSISVANAR